MSKTVSSIVDELNKLLRNAGEPCMTLTWQGFYKLCDRERLKQPLQNSIQEQASGRYQLIVAYGHNAVIVCHDRNFAAAGRLESVA